VDFDKRIDIIKTDGNVYQVWFNRGDNTYSDVFSVSQDTPIDFSLSTVQLSDFNGDRVPDVCVVRPTCIEISAGVGYGQFLSSSNVLFPDWTFLNGDEAKVKLTDINGDGLADVVWERANQSGPGELWYWLNLGNYTLSAHKTITDMPDIDGDAAIRWADINAMAPPI